MCESCGKRFTTYEKVETIPLSVIKKDQTREQYDRSKIQGGILRACYSGGKDRVADGFYRGRYF